MTREEAREAIKEAYGNSEYTDEIIKALEQEPFINKPCVSNGVCEHDKNKVLDKIRAEIKAKCCITVGRENDGAITLYDVFEILDKYKGESEE